MNMDNNNSFVAAGFQAGIQENASDFSVGDAVIAAFPLTRRSRNFSHGRRDGLTSRYGIMPIPGHCSTDAEFTTNYPNTTTLTPFGGLMCLEQTLGGVAYSTARALGADVYDQRNACLGLVLAQVDLNNSSIFSDNLLTGEVPKRFMQKVPYWITTRNSSSPYVTGRRFDLCPPIGIRAGVLNAPLFVRKSRLEGSIGHAAAVINMAGAPAVTTDYATFDARRDKQLNVSLQSSNVGALLDYLTLSNAPTQTWYARTASIKKDLKYINRECVFQISAASVSNLSFPQRLRIRTNKIVFYGYPPLWVNKEITNKSMNLNLFSFGRGYFDVGSHYGYGENTFIQTISKEYNATFRNYEYGDGNAIVPGSYSPAGAPYLVNIEKAYASATLTPASGDYYWNAKTDNFSTAVQADFNFAVIDGKAVCALFIDRMRNPAQRESGASNIHANVWYNSLTPDFTDESLIYVDPCNNEFKPKDDDTIAGASAYAEDGIAKKTAFYEFADEDDQGIFELGAFDAVLQRDTDYQFAYSVYNSLTGKESNIGTAATVHIPDGVDGDTAYVRITSGSVFTYDASPLVSQPVPGTNTNLIAVRLPSQWSKHINHLKYRFFYREYGAFEWLAAGDYDAARLFNNVSIYTLAGSDTGKSPILLQPAFGSTGGQAGGYNDFSDLENDAYIDVTTFQGRVFWCSKTALRYSLKEDVLSYPLRNTASVETGELRGTLAHFFQGQAEQDGRLLIFASDGIFEGRFTGQLQQQAVQVSLTAEPLVLPVDGSDFVISQRTTEVAFSARCAVVAEGVVYFMGPRGIFRDDGVGVPKRISQAIEPFYHEFFDVTKVNEFFTHYNARTREILFYFRPIVDAVDNPRAAKTCAWIYSLRTEGQGSPGAFLLNEYDCLIDWSQDVDTTGFQVGAKAAGMRTIIGARASSSATVSRAYYHDEACSGGDMGPSKEFVVKSIAHPVSGTLRFTLGGGFSAAALAAVTAGLTNVGIVSSQVYGINAAGESENFIFIGSTQNLDGMHTVTAKGADWIEIAKPSAFVQTVGATADLAPAQFFPVFVQGFHDITCILDSAYLSPLGLAKFHQFRKFHALMEPVVVPTGTGEPRVSISWNAPHEYPTVDDSKSFPITPLNVRERTTQVVVDLYNNEMSSQGQGLRLNLTYNQIFGRFTMYMFTVYYNDIGDENIMMYQRTNS